MLKVARWRSAGGLIGLPSFAVAEEVMRDYSRRAFIGAFVVLASTGPRTLRAAETKPGTRVALQGYDPVAYFTDGKPQKGTADFNASFDDTTYWFKNAEHRALFVASPDRYAPQFDGYCAIMVSRGGKYEADPEAWAIADGRLYVFSSKESMPLFRQH